MHFALGMKHKLHGTTPIEHIRVPLDVLTRQTDLPVSSGMSSRLPYTSTSSLGAFLCGAVERLLFSVFAFVYGIELI